MWLCWITFFLNAILKGSFPPWRRQLSYTWIRNSKRLWWSLRVEGSVYFWMKIFWYIGFTDNPFKISFASKALQKYELLSYHIIKNIILKKNFSDGSFMQNSKFCSFYPFVYYEFYILFSNTYCAYRTASFWFASYEISF